MIHSDDERRIRQALNLAYHPALKPAQRYLLAKTFDRPDIVAVQTPETMRPILQAQTDAWFELAHPYLDDWTQATLQWLKTPDAIFLDWGHPAYPTRLRHLADPPLVLFARGNPALFGYKSIASVGSRNASQAGLRNAHDFSEWLARRGWCIVSGLAAGIDGASHVGALDAKGATIAVMGAGIDVIYPRAHDPLATRILAQQGLLLSEYPPGTSPRREFFPRRNRLIAGLCHGLVVVEAAPKSGSLITAQQAGQLGRIVMAIPGSIQSTHARGCHQMIRNGAILVENAVQIEEDVLPSVESERIAGPGEIVLATQPTLPGTETSDLSLHGLPGDQQTILHSMAFDPLSIDEIQARCALPISDVLGALTGLELAGWAAAEAGQRWVRVR
jgi:DNA processing protein